MKVDLHLVSWLRPKMTDLVIKTIARNTKRENYRLVVFDNGSGKKIQDQWRKLQSEGYVDDVVFSVENIGLEPARSCLLYEHTYSPYFICVDNDCLPQPMTGGQDWVERLVDLMEKHEDYAAVACRTQVMIGTGNIFEEADKNGDELVDFPHPGGSLRIMRTKLTREVGGWREVGSRGQEERHICGKLREQGHKTGFATNIQTLHLFGTRGENGTDRWGYKSKWKPARSGHNNVHHPALTNGDDYEEVKKYAGEELAKEYFENA